MNTNEEIKVEPVILDSAHYELESPFNPIDYVNWSKKSKGITKIASPRITIFAYDYEVIQSINRVFGVQQTENWIGFHSRLLLAEIEPIGTVGIVPSAVGAPFSAMTMEELAAVGCKHFLSIGAAGLLCDSISTPCFIVAESAIRDEGLSYHYLPPSDTISTNDSARERLIKACNNSGIKPVLGRIWTTDAIYRETAGLIKKFKKMGAIAVDMEIAALTAVAKFRDLDYSAMIYLSDKVSEERVEFLASQKSEIVQAPTVVQIIKQYIELVAAELKVV
jgi:uridine phosphorylase